MPAEYEVGWYAPDEPTTFEIVTDHTGWRPIEPYGVGYLPDCYSGTVESEPGYIRARTLFGDDPTTYGTSSNIMALPEPTWVGLAVGVMLLAKWGRRRRAH